jgi:hypothetical protein
LSFTWLVSYPGNSLANFRDERATILFLAGNLTNQMSPCDRMPLSVRITRQKRRDPGRRGRHAWLSIFIARPCFPRPGGEFLFFEHVPSISTMTFRHPFLFGATEYFSRRILLSFPLG